MKYWLVKSDPDAYSWDDMKIDKTTAWDGVRNYQARNNLALMKKSRSLPGFFVECGANEKNKGFTKGWI